MNQLVEIQPLVLCCQQYIFIRYTRIFSSVEAGQNRVPFPPAIIKAHNISSIPFTFTFNPNLIFVYYYTNSPYNDVYKEEILSFCKDELNIFPCLRFIKDEEVTTFFDWADVVVLPLSLKSSYFQSKFNFCLLLY